MPSLTSPESPCLRWLHLSDIHFREDEQWDRRATLQALIAKAAQLKEQGLAPDLVFVTGDIANSGKPKEYEHATRFFHELNKILNLDPKDRWFLVPGNHDVDRGRIKGAHRAITNSLQDEAAVEELLLKDPDSLRSLSTRLDAYYAFAADFLGAARALQPDRPWRTDVRVFSEVPIGILQLNSAWIAEGGKADEANLLVGEAQVREALDATPDVFLRIALMHHPMRNLREFDANRLEPLLGVKGGAAFLLRGHLHLNRTKIQFSPDGHLLEIAAGTLYTDEANWPRGFHLGEVDLGKGEARIHLFRYSGEGKGFFASDNLTYENAPTGICKIKLPTACRLGGKKTKPRKTVSEAQRISFTARYRAAAANYHGHARFIGFPNQAARPNARVIDLFVPLKMKMREGGAETVSVTTAGIARVLLGGVTIGSVPGGEAVKVRIVVLGDPGSGKTTLSRFLVMLAAGAITLPGVDVLGEPLPLRVAFRDFVERRVSNPSLSLLDYLEFQAKTELSLALPKGFLEKAVESGQAVLLLDGLDEVGAPEHRAAMRDVVAAFSATYRKLPILVTSRNAGYDDAPLSGLWTRPLPSGADLTDRFTLSVFSEFVLEKFDNDDLRKFVAQWYTVQEPSDPVARDAGIADLLAALNADERVRELARVPILATLIAMIHRVEANLPGERAKLYGLCVRMLLETWPAQAKRPFAEIDPGLQRAYLESLAFEIQMNRASRSSETVTATRRDMVTALLPILRKRDFASEPEELVVGVIERWIDHLEKHSGILVEQSTGVFGFFHLSLMEYLAALGMERELGRNGAIKAIVGHFYEPGLREVSLLAVGSHAEDGDFLDSVYDGVMSVAPSSDFLIRCLREEARFSPEQREAILSRYAETVLADGTRFTDVTLIDQIQRISVRHGAPLRRWIEDRLDRVGASELAGTVAIAMTPDPDVIIRRLANRPDRPDAAGSLLDFFWPGSEVGDWAAREAGAEAALQWSSRATHDLSPLQAIAALNITTKPLVTASLVTLITRTLQSCAEGITNLTRVATIPRQGGSGLPATVSVEPGSCVLTAATRTPSGPIPHMVDASWRFAGNYARTFANAFAHHFASGFGKDLLKYFVLDFAGNFARGFASKFAVGFATYFSSDFKAEFTRQFANEILGKFAIRSSSPAGSPGYAGVPVPEIWMHDQGQPHIRFKESLASTTGEAWIALATMSLSESGDKKSGYLLFRIQNRWLFNVWSAIDRRLPENPTPAQLALYFALGWTQSTTTWVWPKSERWRMLFAAGPGENWLVRSQWHLCRLTDNPDSASSRAALREALRDGRNDEALLGYADRLAELLGIEQ